MAQDWKKNLGSTTKLAYGMYFSSLALAGAVYFFLPAENRANDAEWKMYFHEILVIAGVSVLFARWWGTQLFSQTALGIRFRVNGVEGVLNGLKVAALTGAALADFCVVLGAAFYAFTRNPTHLGSLLGFWFIHLLMTTSCLRQGKNELEALTTNAAATSKAA